MNARCHDDDRPACPSDCDGPCCVSVGPVARETAPRDLDVAELARWLTEAASPSWTPARAVAELAKLRARSVRWRRWVGPGEPAEGVRVQTARWTAFYIPTANVVGWGLAEDNRFMPDPTDDPIPF